MARPRSRFGRFVFLLGLLLLLVLLLEMNRFLPGGWPGGGTHGFKAAPLVGEDASRVRPPDVERPWPPLEGVRFELRGPGGEGAGDWKLRIGATGEERDVGKAPLVLREDAAFREGFSVREGDRTVRHGPGPRVPAETWVVQLPSAGATSATPRAEVRRVKTLVLDKASGKPLLGAEAHLETASGTAKFPVRPDGTLEFDLPPGPLDGARLEVRMEGRPVTSVPLESVPDKVEVAAGRVLAMRVLGPDGGRPAGAAVTVRYAPAGTRGSGEPAEVSVAVVPDASGSATVAVPEGAAATILAEGLDLAPAVRRLSAADGGAPVDLVLEKGIRVPVRVTTSDGSPVLDAEVVAVASVDGVDVVRSAAGGSEGRAAVGPFGPGPVEIFAKARGHAWAATTANASSAMGTVEIRVPPGRDLTLVVETAEGRPLENVLVRGTPEGDGPPEVVPPLAPRWRTDAKGVLRARDLPDRTFTLRLSLPGRRPEALHGVRPGATTYFATLLGE